MIKKIVICLIIIIPLVITFAQAFQFFTYKFSCCPFKLLRVSNQIQINQPVKQTQINQPVKQTQPLTLEQDTKTFRKINSLVGQVYSNHTYSYFSTRGGKKWNCLDFALELTKILKENGYNVICVFGNYNSNNVNSGQVHMAHNWVELTFNGKIYGLDPTFGIVVNDEAYRLYYKKIANRCL